jgi:hypothetical protein
VAGCWRLLAAADAAASSPSQPQLLMQHIFLSFFL